MKNAADIKYEYRQIPLACRAHTFSLSGNPFLCQAAKKKLVRIREITEFLLFLKA